MIIERTTISVVIVITWDCKVFQVWNFLLYLLDHIVYLLELRGEASVIDIAIVQDDRRLLIDSKLFQDIVCIRFTSSPVTKDAYHCSIIKVNHILVFIDFRWWPEKYISFIIKVGLNCFSYKC